MQGGWLSVHVPLPRCAEAERGVSGEVGGCHHVSEVHEEDGDDVSEVYVRGGEQSEASEVYEGGDEAEVMREELRPCEWVRRE